MIELYPFAELELKGDVLFSDFEQHSKLRNILLKNYRKIYMHTPILIKEVIAEHFANNKDNLCIIDEIATPISEKIFLALAGITKINKYENYKKFFVATRLILNAIDNNFENCPKDELVTNWQFLFDMLVGKLQKPDFSYPNLISSLYETEEISIEEKAIMVLSFIRAGIENPRSFIVSAIIRLFQQPKLYQEDKRQFMEEVMRYDCPAKITARYINTDIEIGNNVFKKDNKVWLSFRVANFSHRVFDDPFNFRLRKGNSSLSLGIGAHYCIGKELTYKLSIAILDYIISKNFRFGHNLMVYRLDDSPVFRRYIRPIFITR